MKNPNQGIPLKQWLYQESERTHLLPKSILYRLHHGYYPRVRMIKINSRVIRIVPK